MKKTTKRMAAIIMTFAMMATLFAGCGKGENATTAAGETPAADSSVENTGAATEETVECLYVVPGDEPSDLEAGLAAINAKMAEDGVGVTIKLQYIPWDAWDQKINLMLSTGEKFDLFQVMNDRVSLANYASRGALADISEEMQLYGENILKVNPEIMMKSGQVKGVQYAIPAYWVESAIDPEIFIRKDIMEKYGITEVPTTWEELTTAYETVMKNWEGAQKPHLLIYIKNSVINYKWPFIISFCCIGKS